MLKPVFVLVLAFVSFSLLGQVVLVTDYNPGPDNSFSSNNYQGISFGDRLILPLNSNDHGLEPAVLHNGQLDILVDINPGSSSSHPNFFTRFNDRGFFSAFDPENGGAIWETDGTEEGTFMRFAHGGSQNQRPRGLIIDEAGYLYYTANNVLYRTDGITLDSLFTGINFSTSEQELADNYGLYRGNVAFVRTSGNFIEVYVVEDGVVIQAGTSNELSRIGRVWGISEVAEGLIFGMDVIPSFADEFGTYLYPQVSHL